MPEAIPISSLEIVGYANRLPASMLPAVVPPVFRLKGERNRNFLPSYVIRCGMLCDATERTEAELQALAEADEITLFTETKEARPEHELWIGLDETDNYQPISEASGNLRGIATGRIDLALIAMGEGELKRAEDCCRIALNADDRMIDSLAIAAAIARHNRNIGDERLMRTLALGHVTARGFEIMVDGYLQMISEPQPGVHADLFADNPMSNMATLKPIAA